MARHTFTTMGRKGWRSRGCVRVAAVLGAALCLTSPFAQLPTHAMGTVAASAVDTAPFAKAASFQQVTAPEAALHRETKAKVIGNGATLETTLAALTLIAAASLSRRRSARLLRITIPREIKT